MRTWLKLGCLLLAGCLGIPAFGCRTGLQSKAYPATSRMAVVSQLPLASAAPSTSTQVRSQEPDSQELSEPVTLDDATIPEKGSSPADFVPEGWVLEGTASGLLDADDRADVAIWMVQKRPPAVSEDERSERQRALMILLRKPDGLVRVGLGTKLLQCTACGGAFYGVMDAPVEVKIENRELVVSQDAGSRDVTSQEFRFRWDAAIDGFVLARETTGTRDRVEGTYSETQITWSGTKRIEKELYEGRAGKSRTVNTKTSIAQPIRLEEVDYEQRR
jgi:hypothetical protein